MLKPQGYAVTREPGKPDIEEDTFTCCHCNTIVFVKPGPHEVTPDIGGWCRRCSKNVCGPCADKGTCRPFEKWLEAVEKNARKIEQRNRFFRAVGIGD